MKLYLIFQNKNTGYDTCSAAVVCAPDELTAKNMNPFNGQPMTAEDWTKESSGWSNSEKNVHVEYLGDAADAVAPGIVCASFRAG